MEEKKELDESNKRFMKVMEWTELPAGKFATSIGATQSSISHITSGRNKPGMSMLNRIRENYPEINFEWLLTGNGSMLAETDEVIPSRENDYSYGSLFSTPVVPPRAGMREQSPKKTSETVDRSREESAKQEIIYRESPQRRITEIRIFFDDNTYEIFKPEK